MSEQDFLRRLGNVELIINSAATMWAYQFWNNVRNQLIRNFETAKNTK